MMYPEHQTEQKGASQISRPNNKWIIPVSLVVLGLFMGAGLWNFFYTEQEPKNTTPTIDISTTTHSNEFESRRVPLVAYLEYLHSSERQNNSNVVSVSRSIVGDRVGMFQLESINSFDGEFHAGLPFHVFFSGEAEIIAICHDSPESFGNSCKAISGENQLPFVVELALEGYSPFLFGIQIKDQAVANNFSQFTGQLVRLTIQGYEVTLESGTSKYPLLTTVTSIEPYQF